MHTCIVAVLRLTCLHGALLLHFKLHSTHRFSQGMHNDSSSRAFSFAVIKSVTRASYIARSADG